MNRKQRVGMIVKLLLRPYTSEVFYEDELLRNAALAYQALSVSTEAAYSKCYKNYTTARAALLRAIQDKTRMERLSEAANLLDMFFPEAEMAEQLSANRSLDRWYLERLMALALEFITLRDGTVSIRMWSEELPPESQQKELFPPYSGLYKVELWSEISRVITPDVLIAGYFVRGGIEEIGYLRDLPDNISLSDSILSRLNHQGIAETHMHLSSGMSYLSLWEAVTDLSALRPDLRDSSKFQRRQWKEFQEHQMLILAGWLRLLIARYLEEGRTDIAVDWKKLNGKDAAEVLEQKLLQLVLHNPTETGADQIAREFYKERQECFQYFRRCYCITDDSQTFDLLARGPYRRYRRLRTAPELLLLYFALRHVHQNPEDRNFARIFLYYLRIKNNYFRDRVQSAGASGLMFFRRYYRKSVSSWNILHQQADRSKTEMIYRSAFRNQLRCANLRKLEVKISPVLSMTEPLSRAGTLTLERDRRNIARQLREVIRAYQAEMIQGRGGVPTLGVIYHLLRPDIHHPSRRMCWAWPEEQRPADYVSRIRRQSVRFLDALHSLLQDISGLSEFVVGLDAASEELYAAPWVYAPVYRAARNRMNTYPLQLSNGAPMQNLGLTYHVGEDYHHVLSGLRHIDEVLTYFGYKAGDRIGHGLVLQLDMEEWIYDHEVVSLPIMEYLENLLWVWALCGQRGSELAGYVPQLEQEVMRTAEKLYGSAFGLTPYTLWSAYQAKFQLLSPALCDAMAQTYLMAPETDQTFLQVSAQRSFCALAESGADTLWDKNKLLMTHHCPIYTRHYSQPVFVYNLQDYLPLFQAVQQYVRQKVQTMGIYVETNPTSNLMIGDFSGLRRYPITRLNSPAAKSPDPAAILLSINSDDPLIFNTNVENELALVYHALNYQGLSREDVLRWIDKVRQYGMDSSFIRTVKEPEAQRAFLDELSKRLEAVEKGG